VAVAFCLRRFGPGSALYLILYPSKWWDVVVQLVGDVVAQLVKATGRHQTEDAAVPGSNSAPPQSPERGQEI
jgi:hypothetical protein